MSSENATTSSSPMIKESNGVASTDLPELNAQVLTSSMERAYLAELKLQLPKVKSGILSRVQLDDFLNEMIAMGVDKNTITMLMQENELEIPPKLSEEIKRAGLTELSLQAKKVVSEDLPIHRIQIYVDELKARGWNKDDLRIVLEQSGIKVIDRADGTHAETGVKPLTSDEIIEMKRIAYSKLRDFQEREAALEPVHAGLSIERDRLPEEIGLRFRAHGIAKSKPFDALLGLLNGEIDPNKPFYTTDLKRSDENDIAPIMGFSGPFSNGGFIVLSPPHELNQVSREVDISASGIAGVLVNREWYEAIPRLQKAYPKIKFIRADQMTAGLTNWLKEVDKK